MNLKTLDRNLGTIANVKLEKLRTELRHFVKVCIENPAGPDGYPTQCIGAEAPSGRAPSKNPDEADLNSVEGAADPYRRKIRDDIEMKTNVAYHAIAQIADLLTLAGNKLIECRNLQAKVPEPAKAECWIMRQRADVFEESAHKSDLNGLLDEPRHVCAWVYKFARENAVLPTREQCRAHASGNRVMVKA